MRMLAPDSRKHLLWFAAGAGVLVGLALYLRRRRRAAFPVAIVRASPEGVKRTTLAKAGAPVDARQPAKLTVLPGKAKKRRASLRTSSEPPREAAAPKQGTGAPREVA